MKPKHKFIISEIVKFILTVSIPLLLTVLFLKKIPNLININSEFSRGALRGTLFTSLFFIALILFNIQKRLKFEKRFRESEERYRLLFELSPDPIVLHDYGKIILINSAGLKFLGKENFEEVIGKNQAEFIQPQFKDELKEKLRRARKEGTVPAFFTDTIVLSSQRKVDIEVSSSFFPYKDDVFIISIYRDVTERNLLKETQEIEKLRTEFFANISHELRTPLNVILSSIQLMELKIKKEDNHEHAKKNLYYIKQNSYRLLRLVNNLIDVTKIDAGYFKLNLQNGDIIQIIKDITLSVNDYISTRGLFLVFNTEIDQKIMACDQAALERIILNLLSNAIKFSKPGGTIRVNVFPENNQMTISIKDTGIGIPTEKLPLIFERFSQVDKSFTRTNEGSGIGLSLVKDLVEMQGGSIFVKSELEKGSEFIIKLPVRLLEKQNTFQESQSNLKKIDIEFSDIYSIN